MHPCKSGGQVRKFSASAAMAVLAISLLGTACSSRPSASMDTWPGSPALVQCESTLGKWSGAIAHEMMTGGNGQTAMTEAEQALGPTNPMLGEAIRVGGAMGSAELNPAFAQQAKQASDDAIAWCKQYVNPSATTSPIPTPTTTSPSTTTTTGGTGAATAPSLPLKPLTSSDPPGLLAQIGTLTSLTGITSEYVTDPSDPSWVWFSLTGPSSDSGGAVVTRYGFGNQVNGSWDTAGPGLDSVGCLQGADTIKVPTVVYQQFGIQSGCY